MAKKKVTSMDVAKLAGLPPKVVSRARELLEEMEKAHSTAGAAAPQTLQAETSGQISFGAVNRERALEMLEKTNINELTDAECRELLKDMLSVMS